MSSLQTNPTKHYRAWRSKWRWVVVFWLLQALMLHTGWAVLMWDEGLPRSTKDAIDRFFSGDLIVLSSIIIGFVTLLQAVLLTPIHRPGIKQDRLGLRLLHSGLSATTMASAAWLLLWPVTAALEEVGLGPAPSFDSPLSFSVPIAIWIVAFSFLCSRRSAGVPVLLSVSIAALGAALLVAGLVGALTSAIDLATGRELNVTLPVMLVGGGIGWAVFTPLLLAFCRKRRTESALARIAARLFLGTIIEAAAIIPLDVMVRRKFSCYCEQGTFWALTFCWGVGALALGPMVFLLPLSGRRKRWYAGLCDVCDYDMSGCMNSDRCPECGAGWKGSQEVLEPAEPSPPSAGC